MKSKRILKFYFSADRLDAMLDKMVLANACNLNVSAEDGAERIIKLIEVKDSLSALWKYLDGVLQTLKEGERNVLELYGNLRVGIRRLEPAKYREVKRVVMKFRRRATGIERFNEQLKILDYYCCIY